MSCTLYDPMYSWMTVCSWLLTLTVTTLFPLTATREGTRLVLSTVVSHCMRFCWTVSGRMEWARARQLEHWECGSAVSAV